MHQTGIELRASCPTWTEAAVRLKSSYFGLVVAALRSHKRAPGLFAQLGNKAEVRERLKLAKLQFLAATHSSFGSMPIDI